MAHTVVSGDTLSRISAANGTTVAALVEANPDITDPNRISVGQVIQIPGEEGEQGEQPATEPDDPLAAKVAENFPTYAYLLDHPEIGPLLREAVDEDTGMSRQMFNSKVQATKWYRETSDAQRKWDALQRLDPATAQRQLDAKRLEIASTVRQLGVDMDGEQIRRAAVASLRNGYDARRELQVIAGYLTYPGRGKDPSQAGVAFRTIEEIGNRYMVDSGPADTIRLARKMLTGEIDEAALDTWFQSQARSAYGNNKTITDALDAGGDIRGLWSSRQAEIARLYDITPDEVAWADWQPVINHTNDNGDTVMMDLARTRRHVMEQDDWADTRQGQAFALDIGRGISEWMGRV